jgi:putative peptide zinc metalloprotease protein
MSKDLWKELEKDIKEKKDSEINLWEILERREASVSDEAFDVWKTVRERLNLWKKRPKLRTDLITSKNEEASGVFYVVEDPVSIRYFRFKENEYFILSLLDGNHELMDIVKKYSAKYAPINPRTIINFLDMLDVYELTEEAKKSIFTLVKLRTMKKTRASFADNILHISFALGDADKLVTSVYRYTSFLFSKPSLLIISSIMVGGFFFLLNIPAFLRDWTNIYTFQNSYLFGLLLLFGLRIFVIVTHELAHALCCKHFGGKVHKMGLMFYYFIPTAFADTSDAWLFNKKSQRLWVSFAGPFCTLFWGTLSVFVWQFATSTGVKSIAYPLIFNCFWGSFINLNPLLEYDGYYMLADISEIPNLRKRAFEYTSKYILRYFVRRLGSDVKLPEVSEKERKYFLGYGVFAGIYTIGMLFVGVYITLITIVQFGGWIGYILVATLLLLFIYTYLKKIIGIMRELKDHKIC